jgi:LuxR family transcriptional regulator, maltose regulon positive regulatory protein
MPEGRQTESLRATKGEKSPPASPPRRLTDRELDILRYLPTRLSTTEIAAQLGISPNTVKTHLKNIYQKLGARSRNEAIVKAAQLHVIYDVSTALVTQLAKRSPTLVPE